MKKLSILLITIFTALLLSCKKEPKKVMVTFYRSNKISYFTCKIDNREIGLPVYSLSAPNCSNTNVPFTLEPGDHILTFVSDNPGLSGDMIITIPEVDCFAIDCNPDNLQE